MNLDVKEYRRKCRKKALYFLLCGGKHFIKFKWRISLKYFKKSAGMIKILFDYNDSRFISNKKIAVYTVLFGPYDNIKPIKIINNSCDYFVFTDQPVPENSGWQQIDYSFPDSIKSDNVLKSRYLRMHPHLLFPNYDYVIYLDAQFLIRHDIVNLAKRLKSNSIGMFTHPWAKDIYDEGNLVIHWKRDKEEKVIAQVEKYKLDGYPKKFGMTTTGVIVCKPKDKDVVDIMESWWDEFFKKENTKRDQMCFFYSLWKLGFPKRYVKRLGNSIYDDPIIEQKSWYYGK